MRQVRFHNIGPAQADNVHGRHHKDMIVIHETVSPNIPHSMADIQSVSEYLDNKDYGIHGITDNDGNKAWALGYGSAVFYHTASKGRKGNGLVNSRAIGIEQISRVMLDYRSNSSRRAAWLHMRPELNATAQLIAAAKRAGHNIPLVTSDGTKPGITTHWLVTHTFDVPKGHVDAWPVNNGGYYPLSQVVSLARHYYLTGYKF